ncbi:MAG: N-acetylmuramoyl-L-alanine amidase [Clostridium sp.]
MKITETNLKFKSLSDLGSVKEIVLHHAASSGDLSAERIHQMHLNNGWSGIGYHFVVRQNGTIERGRPESKMGAHCANANSNRLGICFTGNFDVNKMSETQLKAGKELVSFLKGKYPNAKLIRHKDVIKQSTACPGRYFPFDEVTKPPTVNIPNENWILDLQKELNKNYKAKLVEDGIFGPKTLAACPLVKSGKKGNLVKIIQKRLITKGFFCGSYGADGSFGNGTKTAVINFQKLNKLSQDGIIGNNTWNRLCR